MATPKVGSKGGPPIFHHRVLQSQSSQIILAMCRNLNWASNHIQKLVINHFFSSSQNAFNGHCIQKSNFKKGEMCTDAMCCSQVRLGPVSSSHTITELISISVVWLSFLVGLGEKSQDTKLWNCRSFFLWFILTTRFEFEGGFL